MKRCISLILALSLLLCGCQMAKKTEIEHVEEATNQTQMQTVPSQPEEPEQIVLSDAELTPIIEQAEFSLLAAAFLYDAFEISSHQERYAYMGDVDNDGHMELYYSESLLYFDPSEGKNCSYMYSPSGNHSLYLAKDGTVYYSYYRDYDMVAHGDHYDDLIPCVYSTRNPDATEFLLYEDNYCQFGTRLEPFVEINKEALSPEESEAFLEELGLREVETGLQDYTSFSYDAAYADSITGALENAFGSYQGKYTLDIDRDGQDEQVFVYTDFVNGWFPERAFHSESDPYGDGMDQAFYFGYPGIDPVDERTGLIVADLQGDKLVLDAYSIPQVISGGLQSETYIDTISLYINGTSWLIPQALSQQDRQLSYLESKLQADGYTDIFFSAADLSDRDQDEILCIGKQNGNWVLIVIRFVYGTPVTLETVDLSNSACYLSTYEGKRCLVTYQQKQSADQKGIYTSYSFKVLRFDGESYEYTIHSNYVGHYNDQEDAKNIADFFTELNGYIINVVVICDPFSLHGQEWIAPEEILHGKAPEDSASKQEPDATNKEKIGFVNISDPSSWLNLREGPGRDYACILTDPNDPGSIVKQAKGSPVTILETVESEDPDFPVWYKVRIRYQDHEIIGYSAEAYIELAE